MTGLLLTPCSMRYALCNLLLRGPTFLWMTPRPLFVMSPHSNDFDGPDFFQNLVDESVLNTDTTGISPRKISGQLFKAWRGLKRIFGEDFKKLFSFWFQACRGNLLCILLGLLGIDNLPRYHPGFSLHFLTDVLRPFRIDSLMPGIDKR